MSTPSVGPSVSVSIILVMMAAWACFRLVSNTSCRRRPPCRFHAAYLSSQPNFLGKLLVSSRWCDVWCSATRQRVSLTSRGGRQPGFDYPLLRWLLLDPFGSDGRRARTRVCAVCLFLHTQPNPTLYTHGLSAKDWLQRLDRESPQCVQTSTQNLLHCAAKCHAKHVSALPAASTGRRRCCAARRRGGGGSQPLDVVPTGGCGSSASFEMGGCPPASR